MSGNCCSCRSNRGAANGTAMSSLVCLIPQATSAGQSARGAHGVRPSSAPASASVDDFQFLDEAYVRKNFNLPPRALYLDPFRRPLITFPMSQNKISNFTIHRKQKINQAILDGFLDPSEAISAPSVFPYGNNESEKQKEAEKDEEIIYILQLPDAEYRCPEHGEVIKTPRFIWHSCKKSQKKEGGGTDDTDHGPAQGGGPLNRPKPWLLSRHTDFDLMSQW